MKLCPRPYYSEGYVFTPCPDTQPQPKPEPPPDPPEPPIIISSTDSDPTKKLGNGKPSKLFILHARLL